MLQRILAALAALALSVPTASAAQSEAGVPVTELLGAAAEGAVAVLRGERPAVDVFAPAFLAQVPPEQLTGLIEQLQPQFGDLVGLERLDATGPTSGTIAFRFERAVGTGQIAIDAQGRIVGLNIAAFEPIDDSFEDIAAELSAMPGEAGMIVARLSDGAPVVLAALQPDRQFAVGSTFKLYVLSALSRAVAAGEFAWDDVVRLTRPSLPSGQMQDWPAQAPVTIQTLATMMISVSDNTATDRLVELLGRDRIEIELRASAHSDPDRTLPFLSTREAFAIKSLPAAQRSRWIAASDPASRRALLQEWGNRMEIENIDLVALSTSDPLDIESIEWFASPNDVVRLYSRIVAAGDETVLDILAVNSGVGAEAENWAYAGYKGGSEPGVLNLSHLLRARDGEWYVASLSSNDPAAPLDMQALELLGLRMVVATRAFAGD